LRNNTSAYHRSQETFLAYQIFDAMRVNREVALDGGYTVSLGKDLGTGSRAAVDVLVWQEQIAYWLPGGQGGIACAAIEPVVCTVILQWNDARVEGAGSTQQVSVSTRL
jgi:type IV pilus assembly protein PilV